MNFYAVPPLITFLTGMVLAVFVLAKKSGDPLNWYFTSTVASYCLISFTTTLIGITASPDNAYIYAKIRIIASLLFAVLIIIYSLVFTEKQNILKSKTILFLLSSVLLFFAYLTLFTQLIITGVHPTFTGFCALPGPFYWIYYYSLALSALASLYFSFSVMRGDYSRLKKLHAKFLFFGVVSGGFILFLLRAILLLFNFDDICLLIPPAGLVFLSSISYAMLRYGFMVISPESFSENILKIMSGAVFLISKKGRILKANPSALGLTGYSEKEILGRPVSLFLEGEEEIFKGCLAAVIKAGTVINHDAVIRNKSGEKIPATLSGSLFKDSLGEMLGIVCIIHDMRKHNKLYKELEKKAGNLELSNKIAISITEDLEAEKKKLEKALKDLKTAEARLIQAGKMAAMGTLGAGIAHQLNQPLTGIKGFVQAAMMQTDNESPIYPDLKQVEEQSSYMADIISNLAGFARQSEFKKVPLDINQPVEKALQLLSRQFELHGIKLKTELDSNLPAVIADANQIQQVFINFIVNAREALDSLPKDAEKKLTITTRPADGSVEVIFADTGPGIPPEIKGHLFEAFFTTKGAKSIGLGLYLNYGMIEEHGGSIEIKDAAGGGAEFIIKFPVQPG